MESQHCDQLPPSSTSPLSVAACLLIPSSRAQDPAYPVLKHVLPAFGLPIIGAVLCGLAIFSMGLHGCRGHEGDLHGAEPSH